jgi:hypothetical protein
LEPVIVAINVNSTARTVGTPDNLMKLISANREPLFAKGDRLRRIPIAGMGGSDSASTIHVQWIDNQPQVTIRIPPESVLVYEGR